MTRKKFTTTLDENFIRLVKEKADIEGLSGANEVIEAALRLYFANCSVQVWEKELQGGWVKKLIVRPDRVVMESIRCRKVRNGYNPKYYTDEVLSIKGWTKVWKMRKVSKE